MYQNIWKNKPTYRDGTFKEGSTTRHVICLNAWKSRKLYTKEEHILKTLNGQNPTMPVLAGRKWEEHPPRHPTPSRDALASTRESIQAIWATSLPYQKINTWCMAPENLYKSVKSWEITLRSAPCNRLTRTSKPCPLTTNAAKYSSLRTPQKR